LLDWVICATEIGATNAFAFDYRQLVPVLYGMSASAYIQSGNIKKKYC
jgi:hypothetical protein